jgi:hypothetical protein
MLVSNGSRARRYHIYLTLVHRPPRKAAVGAETNDLGGFGVEDQSILQSSIGDTIEYNIHRDFGGLTA